MKNLFFLLLCVIALAGCSPSVPKCGDTETIELIKEIAQEELARQLGLDSVPAHIFYSVNSIRTTDKNEKTGAFTCAAEFEIHNTQKDTSSKIPITYTVEATDDGQEFYVNVFGLRE